MKNLLYALIAMLGFVIVPSSLVGQKVKGDGKMITQTREVGDFTKIRSMGSLDIILEKGDKSTVEVIAEDNVQDIISVSVEKKTLVVRVKPGASFKSKGKTEVHVYKSKLEDISLEGSGSVRGAVKFDLKALNISVDGSGSVNMNVDASVMKVQLNGSGEIICEGSYGTVESVQKGSGTISLKGQAKALKATASGSGELKATALTSSSVNIKSGGSGTIKVHATQSLEVESTGSGNITYKGNPSSRKVNIKGSGKCVAGN